MKNLAGVKDADAYIGAELDEAGIERVVHPEPVPYSEVPMRITGKLGSFEFKRLWYYYAVRGGAVPLAVAQELYEHPVGRRDVRVDGYAGNTPPRGAVDCYHIDSQAGLNLFVETLRRHGLCPASRADGIAAATDADVAREFFRRFGPVKVLVGRWGRTVAYIESDGSDWSSDWLSGLSSEHDGVEEHAAGEDGFVAALERALTLAREGGSR